MAALDICAAEAKQAAAAIAAAAIKAVVEAFAAAERDQLMQQSADARQLLYFKALEREEMVTRHTVQHAKRCIAVLRISNAWSTWRKGPACAQRLAAIIKVQAYVRALIARKHVATMKQASALQQLVCPFSNVTLPTVLHALPE